MWEFIWFLLWFNSSVTCNRWWERVSGSPCSHLRFKASAFANLLACFVISCLRTHTSTNAHTLFLLHPQYCLSWFLPSYRPLTEKSASLCGGSSICEWVRSAQLFGMQQCVTLRPVRFSLTAAGQHSEFTQGAKVLMLHGLKKYKMSSLQL